MKIRGLKNGDLDVIDRAMRYTMSQQAISLRNAVQDGNMECAHSFLEALQDSIATYENIQKEIGKYDKE